MKSNKHTGSYYTPDYLTQFIVNRLTNQLSGKKILSVLEPSVGDGAFIRALNNARFPNHFNHLLVEGVEKSKGELDKAKLESNVNKRRGSRYSFINGDFLDYEPSVSEKFDLIIGNPPYVKKSLLTKRQIKKCSLIETKIGIQNAVHNLWTSFVIACTDFLSKDGVMGFVLPSEFLQVKFCEPLRQYILQQFDRIETFTFDELMFESIGQDTIVLFCYKRAEKKGSFYAHISNREQLVTQDFNLASNTQLIISELKWTHHLLLSEEIELLMKLKQKLLNIESLCESKPGVVTAANKYFIVNKDTERLFKLSQYTRLIIEKGAHVNGGVELNNSDINGLIESGKSTKLVCFPEQAERYFRPEVRAYLKEGIAKEIHKGYKCSNRRQWFVVPNVQGPSEGFFFRRVHHYPKVLRNNANVLVTDSAYQIDMRPPFNIENLIFSFYNSLTMAFAELEGRYYGSGLLELTPNEFKSLPIPYMKCPIPFKKYNQQFKSKSSIADVLMQYDNYILQKSLDLSDDDILKIQNIKQKLIAKRFKT